MNRFNGHIGHVGDIESPWGNAGGVVKSIEDVEAMSKTGVGWIEAGSYTLEPRLGNGWDEHAQARILKDWDYSNGLMHNSLGMPNSGMDVVEAEIPEMAEIAHAHQKPLIVNIAPVSDNPSEESLELIRRSYAAGADGVILNAGCPNVKNEDGTTHEILSKSPAELFRVLGNLGKAGLPMPIWIRTSPLGSLSMTRAVFSGIRSSGVVSAVLHTNTWPVEMPIGADGSPILEVPMKQVGRSGPEIADAAADETRWASIVLRSSGVDLISSSGIMNARELDRRMKLGSVAGASTTFYYASENGWRDDTNKLLSDLAAV